VPELKVPGSPLKLYDTPPNVAKRRPPMLGEHNDEVLGELGYSKEQIDQFTEEGVISAK
jgi:formyl-CoA transferase